MKNFYTFIVAILFAFCCLFVSCSNSAGGGGSSSNSSNSENVQEYKTSFVGEHFSGEATADGIKFTINPIDTSKVSGPWSIYIMQVDKSKKWPYLTRANVYNWSDMTKPWTGIYPFVQDGKNYDFEFRLAAGNYGITEKAGIKAIGGLCELEYPDNWSVGLSGSTEKISAKVVGFTLPAEVQEKSSSITTNLCFFAGTGSDLAANTWDGEMIDSITFPLLKQSVDFNSSTTNYAKIKNALTTTHSGKPFFVEYSYNFSLTSFSDFNFQTSTKQSNVVTLAELNSVANGISASKGQYTILPSVTSGTNGTSSQYVTFGLWPQTIKADNVTVDTTQIKIAGAFTYCKGSDGEWYASIREDASSDECKYSDETIVSRVTDNSYKWFKVEPIKWRILTLSYSGKRLLLAENALTKCKFYDGAVSNQSNDLRKINGTEIYGRNYKHSRIRAFLNGLTYELKQSNSAQICNDEFVGKGFLQTAFTNEELSLIADTTLSGHDVSDKIFLLSKSEVSNSNYGFVSADRYIGDSEGTKTSSRVRMTTDFAKAIGLSNNDGVAWWLRSCTDIANLHDGYNSANFVKNNGNAVNEVKTYNSSSSYDGRIFCTYGVVPALCLIK